MTINISQAITSVPSRFAAGLAGIVAMASMVLPVSPAAAQAQKLAGSWSGSGVVVLPSGDKERAQCRVRYNQSSVTRFTATAICATPSARVEQTARLRRVGDNRYVGTFYNSDYGISGSFHVVMSGRTQTVSLRGDNGASASLRLSR